MTMAILARRPAMGEHKVDFSALKWETPGPDVRFKESSEDGRKLRLLEFDKGFQDEVWCDKGHYGYVIEGEMDVDFGGETVRFKKGDGIVIPGGDRHKHMAHVLTDKAKVILVEES